jgi:hypothetical protein
VQVSSSNSSCSITIIYTIIHHILYIHTNHAYIYSGVVLVEYLGEVVTAAEGIERMGEYVAGEDFYFASIGMYVCVYVCMCVCMCVYVCVCMYVCMRA